MDHTAPLPIGGLSYIQGNTKLRLINKTVGWCLDATAQKIPDKEALVVFHENIRLTFAQLKEQVGPDFEPSMWTSAGPPGCPGWVGGALRVVPGSGAGCWVCLKAPRGVRGRGRAEAEGASCLSHFWGPVFWVFFVFLEPQPSMWRFPG